MISIHHYIIFDIAKTQNYWLKWICDFLIPNSSRKLHFILCFKRIDFFPVFRSVMVVLLLVQCWGIRSPNNFETFIFTEILAFKTWLIYLQTFWSFMQLCQLHFADTGDFSKTRWIFFWLKVKLTKFVALKIIPLDCDIVWSVITLSQGRSVSKLSGPSGLLKRFGS